MVVRNKHSFGFPNRKFNDPVGLFKNFRYLEDFLKRLSTAQASVPSILVAASNARQDTIDSAAAAYQCDGVADEVQIQAAIDELETIGGGRIIFSEGDFAIADYFSIADNVHFEGLGTRLIFADAIGILFNDGAYVSKWEGIEFNRPTGRNGFFDGRGISGARPTVVVSGCWFDDIECDFIFGNKAVGTYNKWIIVGNYFTNIVLHDGGGLNVSALLVGDEGSGSRDAFGVFNDNYIDGVTKVAESGDSHFLVYAQSSSAFIAQNNYILNATTLSGYFAGNVFASHNMIEEVGVAGDHTGITLDHLTDLTNVGTFTHTELDLDTDFFNGTLVQSPTVSIAEAGGTVTMSLTGPGTSDLTLRFSDGHTVFDATPAAEIALTVGSDTSPQGNYIYILQSTKALTKSTSDWPTAEHIKIAFFEVPSAAFVQANGVYSMHIWGDGREDSTGQGHQSHITERQRRMGARWFSGVAGNGVNDYLTIGAGTVDLKSTAGIVYQLHRHAFDAFDTSGGDVVLVKNWSGTSWNDITDLYSITADSGGNAITNNKWFNLVVWGIANESGTYQPMVINLPSGFYHTQSAAEQDDDGHDDFTMPIEFSNISSTGFLIARITVQMKTGGGTWGYGSTVDLRGQSPITAKGGAAATVTRFPDNTFNIHDEADESKVVEFSVGGLTAATTRILTIQDAAGTLEYTGHAPESHSGTDITGAELEELSDGSSTLLHAHAGGGASPLTTKGDVWGYAAADARIPIGTDTHVLTADAAQALGVKWAAQASGSDADAIHDNVGSEISAITAKASPVAGDFLVIEDSAAANAKKSVTVAALEAVLSHDAIADVSADDHHAAAHNAASHSDQGATGAELETLTDGSDADALHTHSADGIDTSAIHDDASAEISVITEKVSPVGADVILIEDSAAGNAKKRVQITNLPAGGNTGTDLTTKGDLHGYDSGQARIPIGTDDHVLTADSAQALGVKWAAAAGGGGTATDIETATGPDASDYWNIVEIDGGDGIVVQQWDDTAAAFIKRLEIIGKGTGVSNDSDIKFYKADGTTISLQWDESDDRWEFAAIPNALTTPMLNEASPLDALGDVSAHTPTKGKVLVADGDSWEVLTVGTNDHVLTADSAQSLGVKWAAAAGGGGGSPSNIMEAVDATPSSPDAMDDEFDDASFDTGLWTDINIGGVVKTEANNGLMLEVNENVDNLRGIYQSTPAGDWTIRAKIGQPTINANYFEAMLFCAAGTTGVCREMGYWADSAISVRGLTRASPTSSVAGWGNDKAHIGQSWGYFELQWVDADGDLFASYSPSGLEGSFDYKWAQVTSGFTPTIVGLSITNRQGGSRVGVFDWFRRIA